LMLSSAAVHSGSSEQIKPTGFSNRERFRTAFRMKAYTLRQSSEETHTHTHPTVHRDSCTHRESVRANTHTHTHTTHTHTTHTQRERHTHTHTHTHTHPTHTQHSHTRTASEPRAQS